MQVSLSFDATVEDTDSGEPVDTAGITDLLLSDERMGNYVSRELADKGVVGGEVWLTAVGGQPRLNVTFWVPGVPSDELLELLETDVVAQLEDGLGEGGFELQVEDRQLLAQANTSQPATVSVIDDGRQIPEAPVIAIAARDGNMTLLRSAIEKHQSDINQLFQGYCALHYAIVNGHVEAVSILLEAGADPNLPDLRGTRPLEHCALTNALDDGRSSHVARLLLDAKADPNHVKESATSYAQARWKNGMVALLK